MLTLINDKFIFNSAHLGLVSSAINILQIADVALWVVFLLFLPCFKLLFRLVLPLETSEMSAIFTTKTVCSTCSYVFSVNGALICNKAALLTSSVY